MNIYDRLRELKNIKDGYLRWKDYREELTEYIISSIGYNKRLAIYGAGRCADIDLAALQKHNVKITLLDNDISAMRDAVEFYNVKNVDIIYKDFLGIDDESYRMYSDELNYIIKVNSTVDIRKLAESAIFILNGMYESAFLNTPQFGEGTYDVSVCAGVCSQINNMAAWIWDVFAKSFNSNDESVYRLISENNNKAVKVFHDAILKSVNDSAIFVNEWLRCGMDSYVEGAYQAISDIVSRKNMYEYNEEVLYWKFDEPNNVKYKMLLQHLKKKNRRSDI